MRLGGGGSGAEKTPWCGEDGEENEVLVVHHISAAPFVDRPQKGDRAGNKPLLVILLLYARPWLRCVFVWIGRGRGRGVNGEGEAVWELRRRIDQQQWPGLPPLPRNASRIGCCWLLLLLLQHGRWRAGREVGHPTANKDCSQTHLSQLAGLREDRTQGGQRGAGHGHGRSYHQHVARCYTYHKRGGGAGGRSSGVRAAAAAAARSPGVVVVVLLLQLLLLLMAGAEDGGWGSGYKRRAAFSTAGWGCCCCCWWLRGEVQSIH